MIPPSSRPGACLNCGSSLVRGFCADCGQRNVELRAPLGEIVKEGIEEALALDSRAARTATPFLLRPGFLTAEWAAGRRARYSSPLRLYLLASAAFFLVTALQGGAGAGSRPGLAARPEDAGSGAEAVGARPEMDEGREEGHAALRALGAPGRAVDDRWTELEKLGVPESSRRIAAAFQAWIPRVMFFLVPAGALFLGLFWRRRWFSEHLVMSLHVHAFAFLALAVAAVLGGGATDLAVLGALVYLALALRRAYGQGWGGMFLKLPVLLVLYSVALALGLAGVAVVAFFSA